MGPCAARVIIALAGLLAALPAAAGRSWHEVRTPHLRVISDAGKDRAEEVAERLEAAIGLYRQLFFAGSDVEVPLHARVYAFKDAGPVNRLVDRGPGAVTASGFYSRNWGTLFIALSLEAPEKSRFVSAQHELAHAFIDRALVEKPLWLNEGLATYLGTVAIEGGQIELGKPDKPMFTLVRRRGLGDSLAKFLALRADAREYRDRDKAPLFYSRAYCITHWLMHGRRGANYARFEQLLRRLAQGLPTAAALPEVYGADLAALDREIRESLAKEKEVHTESLELNPAPRPLPGARSLPSEMVATELSDSARRGHLALLAVMTEAEDELEDLLEGVRDEDDPAVLLARAFERLFANDRAGAAAMARRQLESAAPDALAALVLGNAIADPAVFQPRPGPAGEVAEAAWRLALELDPDCGHALNSLAWSLLATPDCGAEAERLAARAVQIDPGNVGYIDTLAEARLANGDRASALELWGYGLRISRFPGMTLLVGEKLERHAGAATAALPPQPAMPSWPTAAEAVPAP